MQKFIWPLAAVAVIGAVAGFIALKNNTRYRPEAIPRGVPRDVSHEELHEIFLETRETISPTQRSGSRAVVDEADLELGNLQPGVKGEHIFTIRNEGTQTLVLGDVETTGMGAALRDRRIEPGGQTELKVGWTAPSVTAPLRGKVRVPTSDPENPQLRFRVFGQVLKEWEIEDGTIGFGKIDPRTSPGSRRTFVYSPVWDRFEITEVTCSDDALGTWKIFPATDDDLARLKAKSGYGVEITMPPGLPSGGHQADLALTIQPPHAEAEAIHTQIKFGCRVMRRLCIYGDDIDDKGLVDFGIVPKGRGKSITLRVKMRDDDPNLSNVRLEAQPVFVKTEFAPAIGAPGLYMLKITIPPDAPLANHMLPQQYGKLRFQSDHPHAQEETLLLRFAVSGGSLPASL